MSPKLYTISDFQKLVFEPTGYTLPNEVYDTIKYLESCLDVSEYSGNASSSHASTLGSKDKMKRTNGSDSRGGNGFMGKHSSSNHDAKDKSFDSKRKSAKKEVSNDEWEAMRNFKTTKIDVKVGVDKRISDIRITLNKISGTTYEKLSAKVMELIDEYFSSEDECSSENTTKIANAVLSVCVSNKFYSELFAELFHNICAKYEVFNEMWIQFVDETFTQEILEYVDSELDYNAYCKYNKMLEERKSKNTFIVNMMKRGLVTELKVLQLVEWYINTIMEHIMMENKSKEVEELTENLFVLVSGQSHLYSKHELWNDNVYPKIEDLGKSNNKQYPSSSNRIVFKFMDILDSI